MDKLETEDTVFIENVLVDYRKKNPNNNTEILLWHSYEIIST